MPYCSLYDEGYKRLGCIGCPMSGSEGMARDFKRWPKYEALWRRGFAAYWEKYKGTKRIKKSMCPQCLGVGSFDMWAENSEVKVVCLECEGTGKIYGDRWIERFPNVNEFWKWWVSGKAYEEGGDIPDCQLYLW